MGDLNFRIDAFTREEVLEKIKSRKLEDLLAEDDLIKAFDKYNFTPSSSSENFTHMLFQNFMEGIITFMPTYKFDLRSFEYDTSKK